MGNGRTIDEAARCRAQQGQTASAAGVAAPTPRGCLAASEGPGSGAARVTPPRPRPRRLSSRRSTASGCSRSRRGAARSAGVRSSERPRTPGKESRPSVALAAHGRDAVQPVLDGRTGRAAPSRNKSRPLCGTAGSCHHVTTGEEMTQDGTPGGAAPRPTAMPPREARWSAEACARCSRRRTSVA